ncbi:MAG: hypothetical protein HYW07_23540 [Candidatus Latescibacteria bacterium]|nr:hypothetical protein [Candidatus Latescibacterota bacterium]
MGELQRAIEDAKLKARFSMEGGLKRLGALFLKICAVPLIPIGLGMVLYGLFTRFEPLSIGVALVLLGGLLWLLARKLDAAALLVRHRKEQNRIVRLARQKGGRLMVAEAAADTGLMVQEAEEILRELADGGYAEVEVTDSGMMVYRFPEFLFAHEKHWSRSVESA